MIHESFQRTFKLHIFASEKSVKMTSKMVGEFSLPELLVVSEILGLNFDLLDFLKQGVPPVFLKIFALVNIFWFLLFKQLLSNFLFFRICFRLESVEATEAVLNDSLPTIGEQEASLLFEDDHLLLSLTENNLFAFDEVGWYTDFEPFFDSF